jgi:hypothetical protein
MTLSSLRKSQFDLGLWGVVLGWNMHAITRTLSRTRMLPHPLPYAAQVNHPPVVASTGPLALEAGKGTIVTVPLLGFVPYGDPPLPPVPAVFADADGDALQVEVTTPPNGKQGRLDVDAATGAATFTPSKGFKKGVVTFVVRAREMDSEGMVSPEATVRIQYGGWRRHRRRRARAVGPGRSARRALCRAATGPARQPKTATLKAATLLPRHDAP